MADPFLLDAQVQRVLAQAKLKPNSATVVQQVVECSTAFITPSVALSNQYQFFTSAGGVDPRWQTTSFNGGTGSDTSTIWVCYGFDIQHNFVSSAATGLPQALAEKSFLESSYLTVNASAGSMQLASIPLYDLVNYDIVRNGANDGFTTIRKTNSKFNFDDRDVITLKGGSSYLFNLNTPTNLTAGAGVAIFNPPSGAPTTGYFMKLRLYAVKVANI